jgi:hypothetical protein
MEPENQTTEGVESASETVSQPAPFVPLAETTPSASTGAQDAYVDAGWSWGAAMFNVSFAVAIRKYWYLAVMILFFIPLVNFVAMIGLFVFFGMKGREIARDSVTFSNKDQYLGFMKGMDHAGKIMFLFIMIPAFIIGIFASVVLMSLGTARDKAQDAYQLSEEQRMKTEYMIQEEMEQYR